MKLRFKAVVLTSTILLAAVTANAAELSPDERQALAQDYGQRATDPLLSTATAAERARLHEIFNDPVLHDYPNIKRLEIDDFLTRTYHRECADWAMQHPSSQCPPATDVRVQPGKDIADRQCNTCHLVGTAEAPAFFNLARSGKLDPAKLTSILAQGHRMSPMNLPEQQVRELLDYISSLK